jgi:hypothetical protein
MDSDSEDYSCMCGRLEYCGSCNKQMCRRGVSHYCENKNCSNPLCSSCWKDSEICKSCKEREQENEDE